MARYSEVDKKNTDGAPVLALDGVTKIYAEGSTAEFKALSGVNFSIEGPGVYGLIGPNGAGKTTLLRIISGVIPPTSGFIKLFGKYVHIDPVNSKKKIGFIASTTGLYGRLSPRETLLYFGELFELEKPLISKRIDELSDLFEMREFIDKKNETLSFGQRQRVNIARCLLHDPDFFVFDEITEGLDVLTSRIVIKFISYLKDVKKCVLLSTHDMGLAEKLCDRITFLHRGSVVDSGRIMELKFKYNCNGKSLEDLFIKMI